MDSFDLLIQDYLINKERVLHELGDEWSAICYYLSEAYGVDFEPELRKAYNSPIRYEKSDDKPSFSLYVPKNRGICEYMWKDSGLGKSGDLFYLVKQLYDLRNDEQVFRKIDEDFGLGLYSSSTILHDNKKLRIVKPPDNKEPAFIRITSKPFSFSGLKYWAKYGLTQSDLIYEDIFEVQYFWTTREQKAPYMPQTLCFAYRIKIGENSFYKLYQPFNPDFKFIQDYPEQFVEGWLQLEYKQDLLIITKSKKDVAVLRKLGYESVSPKSESTMIQPKQIEWLQQRYKRILILFDNDGKHNGNMYHILYGFNLIFIPLESNTKDISDYREKYGEEKSKALLQILTRD